MATRLDEGTVKEISKDLIERFGDPIVGPRLQLEAEGCSCNQCGGMMELDELTCSQCGMMAPMDQKAPPGREKQVKALKKDPDIDNPWAVAWASYNKR